MNQLTHKRYNSGKRAHKVRTTIASTASRPRLSVHISSSHISAQVIDDSKGVTLAYVTTAGQKLEGTMSDKAAEIGKQIASAAAKAKVKKVVFDRGSRRYHGRIKQLADAARAAGMEF